MSNEEIAKERNDLKSENEMLRSIIDKMLERGNSLKQEIDRLKAENGKRLSCDFVKTAQKKAIKEFAEKLKEKAFNKDMFNDWAGATYVVLVRDIDELLKQYGVEVKE